ncbi:hypothetical protein E4U21_005273 [Claviceps maximensis]|nr:hypothetical protein E4U21_005273 [Claviceps maximensis]
MKPCSECGRADSRRRRGTTTRRGCICFVHGHQLHEHGADRLSWEAVLLQRADATEDDEAVSEDEGDEMASSAYGVDACVGDARDDEYEEDNPAALGLEVAGRFSPYFEHGFGQDMQEEEEEEDGHSLSRAVETSLAVLADEDDVDQDEHAYPCVGTGRHNPAAAHRLLPLDALVRLRRRPRHRPANASHATHAAFVQDGWSSQVLKFFESQHDEPDDLR